MIITINLSHERPLYQQIAEGVCEAVANGQLHPGERLPTGRELAHSLGVNLETVQRAYRRLVDSGVATSRVGRGTRIAEDIDPHALGMIAAIDAIIDTAQSKQLSLEALQSLLAKRWKYRLGK